MRNLAKVENELHFVAICPLYADHRQILFNKITNISKGKWILNSLNPNNIQFNILMQDLEIQIFTAFQIFLMHSFKIREAKLED